MSSIVISGDTSGSITLSSPAVAGSNTVTMPAASGVCMVSGNMPAFSAYQSSAQTLSTLTTTKLLFQTEIFDTNNNFASSTFTPTVAGYYQINSRFGIGVSGTTVSISIYKNGVEVFRGSESSGGTTTNAGSVSSIVYCNGSTDYIDIYAQVGLGQALDARAIATWVTGSMVRGA